MKKYLLLTALCITCASSTARAMAYDQLSSALDRYPNQKIADFYGTQSAWKKDFDLATKFMKEKHPDLTSFVNILTEKNNKKLSGAEPLLWELLHAFFGNSSSNLSSTNLAIKNTLFMQDPKNLENLKKTQDILIKLNKEITDRSKFVIKTNTKQALTIAQKILKTINYQLENLQQLIGGNFEATLQQNTTTLHTRIFSKDNILKEQITEKEQKDWQGLLSVMQDYFIAKKRQYLADQISELKTLSNQAIMIINENAKPKSPKRAFLPPTQNNLKTTSDIVDSVKKQYESTQSTTDLIAYNTAIAVRGIFKAIEKQLLKIPKA